MLKRFFSYYFNSAWIPFVTLVVIFALSISFSIFCANVLRFRCTFLIPHVFNLLAFTGMLAAGIVNFVKKRWFKGIINIVIPVVLLGLFLMVALLAFSKLMEPDKDDFGKDLIIPEGLKMQEPYSYRLENAQAAMDEAGLCLSEGF